MADKILQIISDIEKRLDGLEYLVYLATDANLRFKKRQRVKLMNNLSDRELDARIAREIMLWVPIPNEDGWQSPDGSNKHWPGPPQYSTNSASAMEVVEKMRESGFAVLMRYVSKWYVEFTPRTTNPEQHFGRVQDESLSRAICLAALSAMESEKNETN